MPAPGIAVSRVIENMASTNLTQLLGDDLIHTLTQLDKDISKEGLAKVACTLYSDNDISVLQDRRVRNIIISGLPINKAKELTEKLGIPPSKTLYETLEEIDFEGDSEKMRLLREFFGVVEPSVGQTPQKSSTEVVSPYYGLFEPNTIVRR